MELIYPLKKLGKCHNPFSQGASSQRFRSKRLTKCWNLSDSAGKWKPTHNSTLSKRFQSQVCFWLSKNDWFGPRNGTSEVAGKACTHLYAQTASIFNPLNTRVKWCCYWCRSAAKNPFLQIKQVTVTSSPSGIFSKASSLRVGESFLCFLIRRELLLFIH